MVIHQARHLSSSRSLNKNYTARIRHSVSACRVNLQKDARTLELERLVPLEKYTHIKNYVLHRETVDVKALHTRKH